jgi:chromosome segregation ATPase
MFLRRSRAAGHPSTTAADMTAEERAAMLERVREGIAELAVARRDVDRQAAELRAQLEQLDGLAQRVALSGMFQHGVEILDHQQSLAAQLTEVDRERAELDDMDRQLRGAERRLATDPHDNTQTPGTPQSDDTPRSLDTEPAVASERIRSLTRLESASS